MDLIDQDHLAILLTKLILRVHEDQSPLTSDACPLLKECLRVPVSYTHLWLSMSPFGLVSALS